MFCKICVVGSVVFDNQKCCRRLASTLPHRRRCPASCAPSRQSQIRSQSSSDRCPWCHHRWSQSELWHHMNGRWKSRRRKQKTRLNVDMHWEDSDSIRKETEHMYIDDFRHIVLNGIKHATAAVRCFLSYLAISAQVSWCILVTDTDELLLDGCQ